MFGYVRVYNPEMKMREYEYYRAAYCGLCRALGHCTGCASRLALSYDAVFLALVRMALSGERPEFVRRRCAVHPTKKRLEMKPGEQLDFCARASALLTYHKLRDDRSDERGLRRSRAAAGLILARPARRRAAAALPGLDGRIEDILVELSELERGRCESVDRPAALFGAITEEILAYSLEGDTAAVARKIGRHIGKWIYIVDALDDLAHDVERGRYNPFSCLWGGEIPAASRESVRAALTHELIEAGLGFDLIDYSPFEDDTLRGVISNIIYIGMPRRADDIINSGRTREDRAADERSV